MDNLVESATFILQMIANSQVFLGFIAGLLLGVIFCTAKENKGTKGYER